MSNSPPSGGEKPTFSNALRFPKLLSGDDLPRVYMEWRGLKLFLPPQLEDVGEHETVPISRKWRTGRSVFLKMVHPREDTSCDFEVLRVSVGDEGAVAVLLIADGWPDAEQAKAFILVRVVDEEHVRTLDLGEFLRALQKINVPPFEENNFESYFGKIPDENSAEFRAIDQAAKSLSEEDLKLFCFYCEASIQSDDNFCAKCGKSLLAPDCPLCGELVSLARDRRIYYHAENGHYPWHYAWNERCQNCNHHFVSSQTVSSGHSLAFNPQKIEEFIRDGKTGKDPFEGTVDIEISSGESINSHCDYWDHCPTIRVSITRYAEANRESHGRLGLQESFSITKEEFEAIKKELDGPLSVLLSRQKWSRDTT